MKGVGVYKVVALTINNSCNMTCEHCYLNYDGPNAILSEAIFNHIMNATFLRGIERVVVVGKEPLFNGNSRNLLRQMADRLTPMGISLEIITNGYGLIELEPSTAGLLTEIDISLDGGPRTFNAYRGATTKGKNENVYSRILEGMERLNGTVPINILHTLSSAVQDIDDMMQISAMKPQKILFSPFVMTPEVTNPQLQELSIEAMMQILAASDTFMSAQNAFLILGTHSSRGNTRDVLHRLTAAHRLAGKVKWIGDLAEYVRISYDGLVLNSRAALSPSKYLQVGINCTSLACIQNFTSPTITA